MLPLGVGAAGHTGVPAVGDEVRVYAFRRDTGYEGAYPDWYDVLRPISRGWWARQWDSRKVRVAAIVALAAVLPAFVGWRARRWRSRSVPSARPAEVGENSDPGR